MIQNLLAMNFQIKIYSSKKGKNNMIVEKQNEGGKNNTLFAVVLIIRLFEGYCVNFEI